MAHFPLDGNAGDSSSFSNHGTVYGGATATTDRFNQPNGAMYFDGVNDYINTFTTYDYQERTVSFWFRADRLTGPNAVLIQDANTLNYGAFSTRVLNGDMRGRAGQTSGTLMYSNVNLNQWYHVALVRRTDSAIYYINGVKSGGVISASGGSTSSPYDKLVIGAGRQRNINFFKGDIDDIKIFDCAFTAIQVDSLFNDSSANATTNNCVIGDFCLDGNAIDSSSLANHGAVFGGASSAVDRFNNANGAMYFDGTDDYINTFNTYDIPYRTVSVWFYPERSSGLNQVFTQDALSLTYGTFGARISNGLLSAGSAGNSRPLLSSTALNRWYHLVLVSRPDSGFCYIDGVRVVAAQSTSNGSASGAYDKLVLAVGRQRNQKYYQGKIDDLLILSCDLNDQQVDSLFIAQSPFPPLDTFSLDTTLCLGDSLYFDLDGSSNINYFWDNGSTDTTRTITNPGTYTLRQTRGGDTLIDTIQLSFISPYSPSFIDTSLCGGDTLFVDYSTLGLDSILWFDGSSSFQRSFTVDGTYTFTVFQESCGSSVDFVKLTLDSLLLPISRDTNSCQGFISIGDRLETNLIYQWSNGQNTPQIQVSESGIYTLRVTGGCNTVVDTFRVSLPTPLPLQSPSDTSYICLNGDSVLVGISIGPNLSFAWSNSANSTIQWLNQAGVYTLQVYNNCDTIENQYTVLIDSIIQPKAIPDTSLCALNSLEFDLNFEELVDVAVNGDILFNNILRVSAEGTYIIEYLQNCGSALDTFKVEEVSCDCDFLMPDAFTPNGDGLNDRFRIDNQCENLEHTIQIFNRWGVLVFENQSSMDYWDGTFNESPAKGGVYIYKLQYQGTVNGQVYEGNKKGFITLIR